MIRIAHVLRLMAWAASVACVTVTALAVLAPPDSASVVATTLSTDGLPRHWAGAIALVLAMISAGALVELARMLGRVDAEKVFPAAAIHHFRRFAALLALAAALRVVLPPLAALAMAWRDGHHAVRLAFDGGDLLALLPAAVFFLVARLLDEAARLEDDSRSIV